MLGAHVACQVSPLDAYSIAGFDYQPVSKQQEGYTGLPMRHRCMHSAGVPANMTNASLVACEIVAAHRVTPLVSPAALSTMRQ